MRLLESPPPNLADTPEKEASAMKGGLALLGSALLIALSVGVFVGGLYLTFHR